ncbi:uncharacterized protein PRCAT00004974001 [Priceomyces carsonii]|uniref:uncharacterized protein n=1 Tax=Priceomyces carsonii TaxID=28549 RepID=UPI002ED7CA9F|nr:unnamed protein product [Priceomyces carsonii]
MFKHPVLINPSKYLRGTKRHASELYREDYYDTESLNCNPFANALIGTRSDGQRIRFPRGEMIRLIVDRINDELYLVPLIEDPQKDTALIPSHYILNNERYIEFTEAIKQWKRYIPQKYKFRNSETILNQIKLLPDFRNSILKAYENKVKTLLPKAKKKLRDEPGFLCTSEGELFLFEGLNPVVNINTLVSDLNMKEPIAISYKENLELCKAIFLLLDFKS